MIKQIILFVCFIIILNLRVFSQTDNYTSKFYNLLIERNPSEKIHSRSNLLTLYQAYISSQDHDKCPYDPSCSVYMFKAIKKEGLIKGLIMGSDRLSRCNRNQEYLYELNADHKMIDQP